VDAPDPHLRAGAALLDVLGVAGAAYTLLLTTEEFRLS